MEVGDDKVSKGEVTAQDNVLNRQGEVDPLPQGEVDLETFDLDENVAVSVSADVGDSRRSAQTLEYVEWRVRQLELNFRNAVSAWRKQAVKIEQNLSDTSDSAYFKVDRDRLVRCMERVSECFERFQTLPPHANIEDIVARNENIEVENLRLVRCLSEKIKDLTDFSETRSTASKKSTKARSSTRSSQTSRASSTSRIQEIAGNAAALKAKLKSMALVEQKRAELNRAKVLEELSMTEAKLNVMTNDTCSVSARLPTEKLSSHEKVQKYLSSSCSISSISSRAMSIPCVVRDKTPRSGVGMVTCQPKPAHNLTFSLSSPPHFSLPLPTVEAEGDLLDELPLESSLWLRDFSGPELNTCPPRSNLPSKSPRVNVYEDGFQRDMHGVVETLAEQVSISRLPAPEPGVFKGNPLVYPLWRASFEILIGRRGIPSSEKIFYLKRYLDGEASEAVEGYFLLSDENAYSQAIDLLDTRYGNPFVIANAFRNKLEAWPKVPNRDGEALRKLSDFLRQCLTAMSSISSLSCLNDERENRKMLGKLPDWLVLRWGRIVSDRRARFGSFPPFKEFACFLQNEANIACDPITSLQSVRSRNTEQDQYARTGRMDRSRTGGSSTFAVETDVNTYTPSARSTECYCCGQAHVIQDCQRFLSMAVQERKEFVQVNGLCFGCLCKGHRSRWCRQRETCNICSRRHPTSLHGDRMPNSAVESNQAFVNKVGALNCEVVGVVNKTSMIVPVFLSHETKPEHEVLVYALLDTQSDTTFVLDETSKDLGVDGPCVNLRLSTMSSRDQVVSSRKVSGLVVRGYDSQLKISMPSVYTRDIMPANRLHIPTPSVAERWPHLRKIADKLNPLMDIPVGLLIGYNCPRALAPREVIPPVKNEPYCQRTDLGWGIVGVVDKDLVSIDPCDSIGYSHHVLGCETSSGSLTDGNNIGQSTSPARSVIVLRTSIKEVINPEDISRMMELDFTEGKSEQLSFSQEDQRFLSIVSSGVHQCDDLHYEMPLPFKSANVQLPDSKSLAFHRLMSLKRRFQANPNYRQDYISFMNDVINNGLAERVPDSECCTENGKYWYIPHHGVYHPKKPSKIRVVFDCSAKCQSISLNDCLLQGPDLNNGLQAVLCRFRTEPVAFMCDIKQMFHQFKVNKEHRNFLRFLWWAEGDSTRSPVEYRMKVHIFGAVSSPGCAIFGLKQIAKDNEHVGEGKATKFVHRHFYVDDGLKSVHSIDEAVKLISDSIELCSRGGLILHKFVSNTPEVLATVPRNNRGGEKDCSDLCDDLSIERALGVQWAIESDAFVFRIILKDQPLTRRGILSTVSSVYDPLGFVAPVILLGKQILQQLCSDHADWDDPVNEELRCQWEQWRVGLVDLGKLQVQRCFKVGLGKVVSAGVHHFSDASTRGYAQCSYLRLVDEDGNVRCSLLMGKSRVVPLKPVTIPRLELTAAVVSVKISGFLQEELFADSIYLDGVTEVFWTESKVVLGYINNDTRRFHVYVANRVQRIRDHTRPCQWKYVKTDQNPADDGSRGISAKALAGESKWLTGPDFLWEAKFEMAQDSSEFALDPDDQEVKTHVFLAVQSTTIFDIDRFSRFSEWFRVVRAVANCIRLKKWLLKRVRTRLAQSDDVKCVVNLEPMTVGLLVEAEIEIMKSIQASVFSEEISFLRSTSPGRAPDKVPAGKRSRSFSSTSSLCKLDPFLDDDGILRVGGRLRRSDASFKVRHPAILPRKHHITDLLVRHHHTVIEHQGRGMTMNEIRAHGFWIIGCSSAVSDCIWKCVTCRKLRRPMEQQKMADLPSDRVEPSPPFTFTGMDIFGPWTIREGRRVVKRYGALFTCMSSRAVHVETVNAMTTDSFINALRRFVSIRGPVRQLRSDRGTNFIGAERELRETLSKIDRDRVSDFLLRRQCDLVEFNFNVPAASHMGGAWERQIRSVRNVLSSLLKSTGEQLDDESLRTFLCEAAAIVNSRPLSVQDINDPMSPEPLTPNHLLTLKSKVVLPPPGDFEKEDVYSRKRWCRVQYLADQFWSRWRKEYLGNLQVRPKWNKECRNFEVGDVVLLKDEGVPRNRWPIAVVSDVFPGKDNRVRKVRLRIGDSALDKSGRRTRTPSYLDRPIQKIVLLLACTTQKK